MMTTPQDAAKKNPANVSQFLLEFCWFYKTTFLSTVLLVTFQCCDIFPFIRTKSHSVLVFYIALIKINDKAKQKIKQQKKNTSELVRHLRLKR